jgi:serine/threonine-protein kinase RsbW
MTFHQDQTNVIAIAGNDLAIRNGLAALVTLPMIRDLSESNRGTVEIVVAEVLNNVVEHAYANRQGIIQLLICPQGTSLRFEVRDDGAALPDHQLPQGHAPALTQDILPEGGFGWFLIRSFANDLSYRREEDNNVLSFAIECSENPSIL